MVHGHNCHLDLSSMVVEVPILFGIHEKYSRVVIPQKKYRLRHTPALGSPQLQDVFTQRIFWLKNIASLGGFLAVADSRVPRPRRNHSWQCRKTPKRSVNLIYAQDACQLLGKFLIFDVTGGYCLVSTDKSQKNLSRHCPLFVCLFGLFVCLFGSTWTASYDN
jgi:hypothetical protein